MRHERIHGGGRCSLRLARSREEVRSAQRLRWMIFAEEQGAELDTPEQGYDIDDLDEHCQHLIVTSASGAVIGTYRLLTADAARTAGGYYSEGEFELDGLFRSDRKLLEIGRSCVLPEYRTGSTIALLWSGVAEFLVSSGHDALIGCASIPLEAAPAAAACLARSLAHSYPAPPELTVVPRLTLPFGCDVPDVAVSVPPLLKGYLRSGAVVCGEPCWDPAFNCADLFLYLGIDQLSGRYARRFLPGADDFRVLAAVDQPAASSYRSGMRA